MVKKILKENYVYIIIIVVLVTLLSIIMRSFLYGHIIDFDYKVIDFINGIHDNNLTMFFKILTNFGDLYIPIAILVCILLFIKNKWVFILQLSSYGFAGVLTYIFKLIVARPRPLEALIKMPSSYSFPSGHTLTSFVFYMILFYLLSYKKSRRVKLRVVIMAVVLSILVAFSRVYLGVHYFSDVIGGVILAVPCVLMIKNIINKNFDKELLGKK